MCVLTSPQKSTSAKATNRPFAGSSLDTLAVLSASPKKAAKGHEKANPETAFRKRAKSKHFTDLMVTKRLAHNTESPLIDSYWNAYHCAGVMVQNGNKVTTTYCKTRWCMVCNRIRSEKMRKAYEPAFNQMADPQFLTLTWPNVKAEEIRQSIEEKNAIIRKIRKAMFNAVNPKGTPKENIRPAFMGLKKIECTYNPIRKDYHPHFHLVIDGKEKAETILKAWLEHNPLSNIKGQDLRPLDKEGGTKELFKYFTDFVGKEKEGTRKIYTASVLDNIFRSVHQMHIFQTYGVKAITEDEAMEDIQAQEIEADPSEQAVWKWSTNIADWINHETGEMLSGYTKSEEIEELFNPKPADNEQQTTEQTEHSVNNQRPAVRLPKVRRYRNLERLRPVHGAKVGFPDKQHFKEYPPEW